jgi:hypothetical protein
MNDPDGPARRVPAARAMLYMGVRTVEIKDLSVRLSRLEKGLSQGG